MQMSQITQEEAIALLDGSAPIEERAEQLGIVHPAEPMLDSQPRNLKKLNMVRSEASHKAWETRKANAKKWAAEQAKAPVTAGGITFEQSQRLRDLTAFVFEKREAFAQAETELRDAESALDFYIQSITAK